LFGIIESYREGGTFAGDVLEFHFLKTIIYLFIAIFLFPEQSLVVKTTI
jgi:hypothetical protein